jgi:hypothetical protein
MLCLMAAGCARWPQLEHIANDRPGWDETLRDAPVILIGRVAAVSVGPAAAAGHLARATISVENVLRGDVPNSRVDIYFHLAPQPPDSLGLRERYVFFLTRERGVLRREGSIPIASGRHAALPLSTGSPVAERVAVMLLTPGDEVSAGHFVSSFPKSVPFAASQLGRWRTAKLLKELSRDQRPEIRLGACAELTRDYWGQDACWSEIDGGDRRSLSGFSMSRLEERRRRRETADPDAWWKRLSAAYTPAELLDELRLLTAHRDPRIRQKYCAFLRSHYAGETDCGCYPRPAKSSQWMVTI